MLTVAYLANQFPSAVEPYVTEEIEELRRRGVRVIAGSVRKPQTEDLANLCEPEIVLQPLPAIILLRALWLCVRRWKRISSLTGRVLFRGSESPFQRVKALVHTWLGAGYAVLLEGRGVDHIHVHHGYFGSWIAMVAARLLGVEFSLTLHGSDLLLHGTYLDVKLECCTFCLTVSEYNRRYILQRYHTLDAEKVVVARLGVEVSEREPLPVARLKASGDPLTLLAVGRLHAVKDHAFLIRACARLQALDRHFECLIAGDGPERRNLESLIRKCRLEDRVTLLGHVARERMSSFYDGADVVVLTSRSEGIPLVLMEAMARSKIVLAPAITGIPELVIAGKTGFLYEPGSLDDLVDRLIFIRSPMPGSLMGAPDHPDVRTYVPSAARQLDWVRHAARLQVRHNFNRSRNLESFGDLFLQRIAAQTESVPHENFVLQQIYYPFSGTEVYLFELMDLMRAQGHEVALFSMADPRGETTPYDRHFVPHIDFKAEAGWWQKARQTGHAIYSTDARRRMRAMIADFRPDVAHVRNIYHHLSPSILWELKAQNVPVLYHLNDFKILCPSYNLVSQGEACEACKGGAFRHVVTTKCYPGLGARMTLATEAYVHRWLGTYRKCVTRFLAPSQFVRDKFVEHGWDGNQFEVLPHFQKPHTLQTWQGNDGPLLYFGRLSAEKGVDDLLRSMQQVPEMRLIIAGDGPQRGELQELAVSLGLSNVKFVGHVGRVERDLLIAKSRFTVLPSHAYETLGKTILESYAEGRAVVASDLGSRRELVHEGETGLLYRTGDVNELAGAIQSLGSTPELARKLGRAGWETLRQRHTPEQHYQKLLSLYEVLAEKKATGQESPASPARHGKLAVCRNRRLRIAFIGGRGVISKYSGIETYYEEVGRRLTEMGHEVTVYCRNYFTPALAEHNGMRLVRLPTIRSKHLETVIHTVLSSVHALTQPYDLVHYHALGPALFSFLPRLLGKKTAVTVQGLDWQRKKWGRMASAVLRLGERASVQFPDATLVVSHALQRHYRQTHGMEAFYVPNGGVLRERSEPRKILEWGLEPGKYVLFLGRFSPEKGCHLLVEAFEQIETEVKLVMAGAASYCDEYSRELRTHASERIRMLNWVSGETLDELLTNAMIFVLPSDLEGLSLALLDAMGAGLCVLTSDVPENREVVDGAGFTFQRGRAADLADRLRFLIANPAVREAAGRTAKERIEEQYQWQRVAESIEAVYFKVLGAELVEVPAKKANAKAVAAGESGGTERRAG